MLWKKYRKELLMVDSLWPGSANDGVLWGALDSVLRNRLGDVSGQMMGDGETVLGKVQDSRYQVCGAGGGRVENTGLEMRDARSCILD